MFKRVAIFMRKSHTLSFFLHKMLRLLQTGTLNHQSMVFIYTYVWGNLGVNEGKYTPYIENLGNATEKRNQHNTFNQVTQSDLFIP